ncbi:alpha-1B adrenergic receptor [Nematostella vectensis]|nr:alpha-1B adrenergic receptor [Nematostella vectensis]
MSSLTGYGNVSLTDAPVTLNATETNYGNIFLNGTNTSAALSSMETVLFACFYFLICVFATFGNLLVLAAIARNRCLQTPSNYLLANLAITDSLQGMISIPLRIAELLLATSNITLLCQISIPISTIFGSTSNITILFISIERFVAILFPYFYYSAVTPNTIFVTIAGGWTCTVILGLLPSLGWGGIVPATEQALCRFPSFLTRQYITTLFIIVHFIPITTVICLYGFILRASLRHSRRIHVQEQCLQKGLSTPHESTFTENSAISTMNQEKNAAIKRSYKQQKAARMVAILVGMFIVLVVPIILIDLIEMVGGPSAPSPVIKITICMIYANHCINVFIYAGCNRDYKRAFKVIISSILNFLKGLLCRKHCFQNIK